MKDTKEVRCVNKNGFERWISEHLTKDPQYMAQMELTIEDPEAQKKHFEQTFEKLKTAKSEPEEQKEDESVDEFSEITASEDPEAQKKEVKGNKKK